MQDQFVRIKDLPEKDRPRERLLSLGPESLTDKELLAILTIKSSYSEKTFLHQICPKCPVFFGCK